MKAAVLLIGLAVASEAAAIPVVNPGFETGDFSGWTTFRPGGDPPATNISVTGTAPHSGRYQAQFGDYDNGSGIQQSLATVAGQTYAVSFWLKLDPGATVPTDTYAQIKFGGTTVLTLVGDPNNGAGLGWTLFGGNAVTAGASTTLSFFFEDLPSYYHLDDVSVDAVPEPATWTMMIAGFALVGVAARRCRSSAVA